MIEYIEEFLGLPADTIINTDFGIMISMVFLSICFFALVKIIHSWFQDIFGRY